MAYGVTGRQIGRDYRQECVLVRKLAPIAIGLIIIELLTNAIKHGFPEDRGGRLQVSAKRTEQGGQVVVQDDGPGIPGAAHQGLGKTLIGRLSKQIGGKTLWLPADPGTRAVVDFPVSG